MAADLMARLAERRPPSVEVDVERMVRQRHGRLQADMARQGIDVAVLLHGPHVTYATGVPVRAVDVTHAVFERPVAVVVAGQERPHLLGDGVDGPGPVERHPAVWPELDEGAELLGRALAELAGPLAGRRVAVDARSGAMRRAGLFADADLVDATAVLGAARAVKTADEIECIAEAQRRNEVAMEATRAAAQPGATRSEVAGVFLSSLRDVGVETCLIDPILEVMPRSVAEGPWTIHGGIAFPTGIGNPTFAEGDVVWVDTGADHLGYASDFGRTWIVGRDPDVAERRLFERWCDIVLAVLDVLGPGISGGELCRAAEAAAAAARPWLHHFYLAHGVGVESAEHPLLGTDLGPEYDDGVTLQPGMVLVLEPVAWEDGAGGYRAEEIVTVTEDGWRHLGGGAGYQPFAA